MIWSTGRDKERENEKIEIPCVFILAQFSFFIWLIIYQTRDYSLIYKSNKNEKSVKKKERQETKNNNRVKDAFKKVWNVKKKFHIKKGSWAEKDPFLLHLKTK